MVSLLNYTKHLRKKWYKFSTISSRKRMHRVYFLTHFMRQHFPNTKTRERSENYSPIYFMNLDIKILNDILAKLKPRMYRNNYMPWSMRFLSGMWDWFNIQNSKSVNVIHHIDWLKKNYMIFINWCRKMISQNPIFIHNKNSWKSRNKEEILPLM